MIYKFDKTLGLEDYEAEWKEDLPFNKYDLDNEFPKHPNTYMKWVKIYAGGITARKISENKIDELEAKKFIEIKKDPEKFDLKPKPTDGTIKALVSQDKEVKALKIEYYRLYEMAKALEFAIKAFEHKKELMKGEGELWANQYYSMSTVFENVKEKGSKIADKEGATDDFKKEMGKRKPRKPLK
jgi:hypothetical protein